MQATIKKVGQQAAREYHYPNGAKVLVSYATPVAAYIPGLGWLETTTKFSSTTARHISQFKGRYSYPATIPTDQREIEFWMMELDGLILEAAHEIQ